MHAAVQTEVSFAAAFLAVRPEDSSRGQVQLGRSSGRGISDAVGWAWSKQWPGGRIQAARVSG